MAPAPWNGTARPSHLAYCYSQTFRHWYDYGGRGLLSKVYASTSSAQPTATDVSYSYRPGGALASRQYADGPLVALGYDIREQLVQIGDPATASSPFSARYGYHANGVVSEAEFYSAGSPAANKRYKYSFPNYDALNRLKGADFSIWLGSPWTGTADHSLSGINYDKSGNLIRRSSHAHAHAHAHAHWQEYERPGQLHYPGDRFHLAPLECTERNHIGSAAAPTVRLKPLPTDLIH